MVYWLGADLRKIKKSLATDVDVHGCREKAMTSPVHADNLSPVAAFHPTVSCRGIVWLLF
jgi:hypothetical protein